jgi:hypothetical protein
MPPALFYLSKMAVIPYGLGQARLQFLHLVDSRLHNNKYNLQVLLRQLVKDWQALV